MPFCNQIGIPGLYCQNPTWEPIIPFWLQKGIKNRILLMQFIFSKNIDLKLSKDVPGMLISFLERILSFFEIWWKSEKSGFFAIFEKNDRGTKNHKLRSGRRKNILRPLFERLWCTLSISNFIFTFWCSLVTQTVNFRLDANFRSGKHQYRLSCKKA